MTLSKKSMDELQLASVIAALLPNKKEIDPTKISDEAERQLLINTIKLYSDHQDTRKDCEACKISFEKYQCVCGYHFHDYCNCNEDWCLPCLLVRSGQAAYPDDPKWFE